jgi:SAM-dependent methyltransferase
MIMLLDPRNPTPGERKDSMKPKRALLKILVALLVLVALDVALFFPRATDPPWQPAIGTPSAVFYNQAYSGAHPPLESKDYVATAREAAARYRIEERVRRAMERYGPADPKVLEVGSGSGLLQDVVRDYTGLDIAETAACYYHKPFVAASADSLPFADDTFDAVWSVWVLEHLTNPERALAEMRRVVRPGGILVLMPAWNVSRWAARGYQHRPDFDWKGKLLKASVPVLRRAESAARRPIRLIRRATYQLHGDRTPLRFHALTPNYDDFLVEDSDAAVSLDHVEAELWFRSRGDHLLEGAEVVRVN